MFPRAGEGACGVMWCAAETPPGQTPPWADIPRADTTMGRHPLHRHPLGRHPWAETPSGRHPQAETPFLRRLLQQTVRILLEWLLVSFSMLTFSYIDHITPLVILTCSTDLFPPNIKKILVDNQIQTEYQSEFAQLGSGWWEWLVSGYQVWYTELGQDHSQCQGPHKHSAPVS